MGRFDYVKYDEISSAQQAELKQKAQELESLINKLYAPHAKLRALDKLEETYMWIGKAIRDDQIGRNGSAELMEERKNG